MTAAAAFSILLGAVAGLAIFRWIVWKSRYRAMTAAMLENMAVMRKRDEAMMRHFTGAPFERRDNVVPFAPVAKQ